MLFDAEAESKRQEIFDLLLIAGYFRIRIPSLEDFDKILGGISWGILCSGFDIDLDLEYSDEFQLGQKIKLAERVIKGLKTMKCPYPLLPHQLRGLDYASIYPVVTWLLKFVDETRQQRQDTNQMISSEIGDSLIYKERTYFEIPRLAQTKVHSKNKQIAKFTLEDPIRVYSGLAELGDKKAASIYQKMVLERDQRVHKKKEDEEKKPQKPAASGDLGAELKMQAGRPLKPVKPKEEIVEEEEIAEVEIETLEGFTQTKAIKRSGSIDQNEFLKLIELHQDNNDTLLEKLTEIETVNESQTGSLLQKETEMYEEQKLQLQEAIKKTKSKLKEYESILEDLTKSDKKVAKSLRHTAKDNEHLKTTLEEIESKISKRKNDMEDREMKEIEDLIVKIIELKEKKGQIKAEAKEETKKKKKEIEKITSKIIKIEKNDQVESINQDFEERKAIYQKKQEELAQISKEVSLLQRKVQEFPSSVELSQYYKRYVDLFEKVAEETDNQRKLDLIYNRRCDIQRLCSDQTDILKEIKKRISECKKKPQREKVIELLESVFKQTKQNEERAIGAFDKSKIEFDSLMVEFDQYLGYQRDYFQLLKRIQFEYEKLQE